MEIREFRCLLNKHWENDTQLTAFKWFKITHFECHLQHQENLMSSFIEDYILYYLKFGLKHHEKSKDLLLLCSKQYSGNDIKLHHMARLQFWSFWKCGVSFHSDPNREHLLGSHTYLGQIEIFNHLLYWKSFNCGQKKNEHWFVLKCYRQSTRLQIINI